MTKRVAKNCAHFGFRHLCRVASTVIAIEALDPEALGLFGLAAVITRLQCLVQLVKQLWPPKSGHLQCGSRRFSFPR